MINITHTINISLKSLLTHKFYGRHWDIPSWSPLVKNLLLQVQRLRVHLPMQGTWFSPWLVWEDSTCLGATKPNEQQLLSSCSGACAPQQEKSLQWETRALQLESSPCSLQSENTFEQQQRPSAVKNKLINSKNWKNKKNNIFLLLLIHWESKFDAGTPGKQ